MASGFIQDRRLHADSFIIRMQSTIRTDGFIVRARFLPSHFATVSKGPAPAAG